MTISAQSVPILNDNYAWLLKDSETGATEIGRASCRERV